jgi:hypothetical protein
MNALFKLWNGFLLWCVGMHAETMKTKGFCFSGNWISLYQVFILLLLPIRAVRVKHRQGSRNVYIMYLTTTTTPQWQHTDGSTRQATGTDHHCLGTFPNAAKISLYPLQRRTRVTGWTILPLPHKPPHRNWTACPSESSSRAQIRDSHTGRDRGCKGGDTEHPSQNGTGCPVLRGQHVGVRYRGA